MHDLIFRIHAWMKQGACPVPSLFLLVVVCLFVLCASTFVVLLHVVLYLVRTTLDSEILPRIIRVDRRKSKDTEELESLIAAKSGPIRKPGSATATYNHNLSCSITHGCRWELQLSKRRRQWGQVYTHDMYVYASAALLRVRPRMPQAHTHLHATSIAFHVD